MNHDPAFADPEEWAALYAAGALPPEEGTRFDDHLAQGCDLCQDALRRLGPVVRSLAGAVTPVDPGPEARQRLLGQVVSRPPPSRQPSPLRRPAAAAAPGGPDQGLVIRRAAAGAWEEADTPGVQVRILFVDYTRNHFSALVRMAPGTQYPGHTHRGPEECLVLEGDLRVGEEVLYPGDYQRAEAGSAHGVQSTRQGCLVFISSSLSDEFTEPIRPSEARPPREAP